MTTFGLAVLSVGLWTVRVVITSSGRRAAGSLVATVEATTYVGVVSHLVGSLDAPQHLLIYGVGVGLGTFAGLTVVSRFQAVAVERAGTTPDRSGSPARV